MIIFLVLLVIGILSVIFYQVFSWGVRIGNKITDEKIREVMLELKNEDNSKRKDTEQKKSKNNSV